MFDYGRMRRIISLISLLVIFLLAPFYTQAASLYKDCIMASDFGDSIPEVLAVTPAGKLCQQTCDRECARFSRKNGPIEFNTQIIQDCLVKCRAGTVYSTNKLKLDATTIDTKTYTADVACDKNSDNKLGLYYPHETQVVLSDGESVFVKLKNYDSLISMCGNRIVNIVPEFKNYDGAEWSKPGNQKYYQSLSSNKNKWNARNNIATDIGLYIKDGDFLNITYTGKYRHWQCLGKIDDCTERPGDLNLYIKNPNAPFNTIFNNNNYDYLPGEKLVKPSRSSNGFIYGADYAAQQNSSVSWNGLKANLEMIYTDDPDTSKPKDIYGENNIRFSGLLKGFSSKYTKLGIMHFDANKDYWVDNIGGYDLQILSQGCIFGLGQRLQYAIGKEKPNNVPTTPVSDRYNLPEPNSWVDVPSNVMLDHEPLTVNEQGKLYLRIKPMFWNEDEAKLPICANGDANCNKDLDDIKLRYGPGEASGYYIVQVEKIVTEVPSNILSDTIRDIRTYFFGIKGQGGMVQTIFNRFVANSEFVNIIRALLLLYITWTGLSFMIGIAQITQREGVMRILYMGIVIALISPNSWQFFNTYLFQLFVDGGIQLMSYSMNPNDLGLPPNTIAKLQDDPTLIFSILDKPLNILFGKKTWIKIYAIILTNTLGILLGLAVLFAGIIYGITILKAMLMYVVSLIFMAILLILAPVFISFSLFKYTREMFQKWLQQLGSVMLQPVFIVLGLGIFSNLILAGLYAALSVTVCSGCLFSFYIPIPLIMTEPYCIWPAYFTVYGLHSPTTSFSPVATVSAIFYFLIVAQGAYVYCSKISELINGMVVGMFQGVSLAGYSNVGEYTSAYVNQVRSTIGYATLAGTKDSQGNLVGIRAKVKSYAEAPLRFAFGSDAIDPKKPEDRKLGGAIGGFAKGVNAGVEFSTGYNMFDAVKGQQQGPGWGGNPAQPQNPAPQPNGGNNPPNAPGGAAGANIAGRDPNVARQGGDVARQNGGDPRNNNDGGNAPR